MSTKKTIIIIGGANGGITAAFCARQNNEHAKIILLEKEAQLRLPHIPVAKQESLFRHELNIDVRTLTKAVSLDMDTSLLVTRSNDKEERIAFDTLIYSASTTPKTLEIPALYGERVCYFESVDDLSRISMIKAPAKKNAVVVGGGFLGVEASLVLSSLGFRVSLIEAKKRIMNRFSLAFSVAIMAELSKESIDLKLGCTIEHAKKCTDDSFLLELSNGQEINADLVVVAIGKDPNNSLLANKGAALDPSGYLRVDDYMATTLPQVYACGGGITLPHFVTDASKWIKSPKVIERTAMVAGLNASLFDKSPKESLKPCSGTLLCRIKNIYFARTGLAEEEAKNLLGYDQVLASTVFADKQACVRLFVDKAKNHIIGGEVFGQEDVERRIDLIAVAVLERWCPDKLIDLDMASLSRADLYLDPLKEAAMRTKMAVGDKLKTMSGETIALWLASNREFHLVDVEETPLFLGRTAKKAIHLPLSQLRARAHEFLGQVDTPIVFCSKSGRRSYLAEQTLRQLGAKEVYHLDGGLCTWQLIAKPD